MKKSKIIALGKNMQKNKNVSLFQLFKIMICISTFTFGGGFVIIGLMKNKFCDELHWLNQDEVLDLMAIAQSAPGALAVNSAAIFGYRLAGLKGAIISTIGTVIPPMIIILFVAMVYQFLSTNQIVQIVFKVMRVIIAAIIVDVVIDLANDIISSKEKINILLMILAFIASYFFKASAIALILFFISLGILRYFWQRRKEAK